MPKKSGIATDVNRVLLPYFVQKPTVVWSGDTLMDSPNFVKCPSGNGNVSFACFGSVWSTRGFLRLTSLELELDLR